jgi:hypothetical protein
MEPPKGGGSAEQVHLIHAGVFFFLVRTMVLRRIVRVRASGTDLLKTSSAAGKRRFKLRRFLPPQIAAAVAPLLSIPRGPKISTASAAHEILLEELVSVTGSQGYTWDSYKEDYSDPLTQATRREFRDPDFDPRAAYRRVRARWKEKPITSPRRTA